MEAMVLLAPSWGQRAADAPGAPSAGVMEPKSSWFAVRCHFLLSLSGGGQGGQRALWQLLLLQQLCLP